MMLDSVMLAKPYTGLTAVVVQLGMRLCITLRIYIFSAVPDQLLPQGTPVSNHATGSAYLSDLRTNIQCRSLKRAMADIDMVIVQYFSFYD